jgi:hypothetical protein
MIASLAGLTLAGALAAASPVPALRGAESCSNDSFAIDGKTVSVQVCAPSDAPVPEKGKRATVPLRETVSGAGASFVHETALTYHPGSEPSRTIDDVPLDKLGMAKSLHLTIGYRPGSVTLEHVLLVPGAVPLK